MLSDILASYTTQYPAHYSLSLQDNKFRWQPYYSESHTNSCNKLSHAHIEMKQLMWWIHTRKLLLPSPLSPLWRCPLLRCRPPYELSLSEYAALVIGYVHNWSITILLSSFSFLPFILVFLFFSAGLHWIVCAPCRIQRKKNIQTGETLRVCLLAWRACLWVLHTLATLHILYSYCSIYIRLKAPHIQLSVHKVANEIQSSHSVSWPPLTGITKIFNKNNIQEEHTTSSAWLLCLQNIPLRKWNIVLTYTVLNFLSFFLFSSLACFSLLLLHVDFHRIEEFLHC